MGCDTIGCNEMGWDEVAASGSAKRHGASQSAVLGSALLWVLEAFPVVYICVRKCINC